MLIKYVLEPNRKVPDRHSWSFTKRHSCTWDVSPRVLQSLPAAAWLTAECPRFHWGCRTQLDAACQRQTPSYFPPTSPPFLTPVLLPFPLISCPKCFLCPLLFNLWPWPWLPVYLCVGVCILTWSGLHDFKHFGFARSLQVISNLLTAVICRASTPQFSTGLLCLFCMVGESIFYQIKIE